MSQSIHGHEVMRMMLEMDGTVSRESLKQAIIDRFGAEASFHTCSAEAMTADGLITFLEERGKIGDPSAGYSTDASQICDHE